MERLGGEVVNMVTLYCHDTRDPSDAQWPVLDALVVYVSAEGMRNTEVSVAVNNTAIIVTMQRQLCHY